MSAMRRVAIVSLLAAAATGAAASRPVSGRSADSTLAVATASGWETWWRRGASPSRWDGSAPLAHHVVWNRGAPGVEWGELTLKGNGEATRTRLIVVRLDPRSLSFSLDPAFSRNQKWTIGSVERDVAVALDDRLPEISLADVLRPLGTGTMAEAASGRVGTPALEAEGEPVSVETGG